jgi:hypothetical protein
MTQTTQHHTNPGGIKGGFQTLRKLLAEKYDVTDLPEHPVPPAVEGVGAEAPAAAG